MALSSVVSAVDELTLSLGSSTKIEESEDMIAWPVHKLGLRQEAVCLKLEASSTLLHRNDLQGQKKR